MFFNMMEEYPSLAEGVGLENREAPQGARGFESLLLRHTSLLVTIVYRRGVEQSGSSSGS